MGLTRRQLCKYAVSGGLIGSAGCQSAEPPVRTAGEPASSDGDQTVNRHFGHAVQFQNDDGQGMAIMPTNARITNVFFDDSSDDLRSTQPDAADDVFLTMQIEIENTGTEAIDTPDDVAFRIDGTEYPFDEGANPRGSYDDFEDIVPGTTYETWLTFEIPAGATEGELVISETYPLDRIAVWSLDLDSVDRTHVDYNDRPVGTDVTVGTESRQFSFAVTSVETLQQYQYVSNGTEQTNEADDGAQFVRLSVRAENTGQQRVKVPRPYECTLIAGSSQYGHSEYGLRGETYTGGLLSSGVTTEGTLLFEISDAADPSRIEVELARELLGTWIV